MKLGRKTKVRQNFLCLRLIHHSRYPFFISFVMVQPTSAILILIDLGFRFYSRQSINHVRLNPSSFYLPSFLRITRPLHLPFILPPRLVASTSRPRQSLFFVLGPLGRATYPILVVGVTCTLSSRSFLSSPACYVPAKFNVSISFAVVFLQLFEPRHYSLSIGYRLRLRSCQCLHGFAICLPTILPPDPSSHLFSGLMAPLGLSVLSLSTPAPLFVMFLGSSSFPAHPGFSQHHRLFLSQHFFLRFRYPVSLQPNLHLRP